MAAINIFPRRPTTTTAIGGGAINHDFTVPGGKRWLLDYVETEFVVQNVGNTVDIQTDASGGFLNIWEQLFNFRKQGVDLAARYPRATEYEAGVVIRLSYVRAGAASAITTTLHIVESDL